MGTDSKIEWTHHTFNPWRGCTKVSTGCANCYAERQSARNPRVLGIWGDDGTRSIAAESYWKMPALWNRRAEQLRERQRVFCASLADFFEGRDTMPEAAHQSVAAARARTFELIDATPHLDWLLLTKRPENIHAMWPGGRRENVWLIASVEHQRAANERVPRLVKCADLAPVLGLSAEPLLGPIDHNKPIAWGDGGSLYPLGMGKGTSRIGWVIAGGESGPQARPMHPDWARSIRDQSTAAGVPFFFKQWGDWAPNCLCGTKKPHATIARPEPGKPGVMFRCGKNEAGRVLDGRTWDEMPIAAGVGGR